MARELVALLGSEPVAVVSESAAGRLDIRYEPAWRRRRDAYPLSLAMPLTRARHGDEVVRPWLEGLLPDNNDLVERWARRFHVSAGNAFGLLEHLGEDCAGAVQLVPPARIEALLGDQSAAVEWLSEAEIAERLRDLVQHRGTGRAPEDVGYFSLAGAQPKTAFIHEGDRWGIPAGRIPTTHILKPPVQRDLSALEINEHLCLRLAREIGLPVAHSEVCRFEDQVAIVVTRYDRARLPSGELTRIHQEDLCQALSVSPQRKYEAEGGPAAGDFVRLLIERTDDPDRDLGFFLDALALNWVLAGTEAHAKNYSIILRPGSVRLAPLYDLVSTLPYPRWIPFRKAKLAMRIDREYHVWKVRRRHWEQLAIRCDLDVAPVVERVTEVVGAIPAAIERVSSAVRQEGIDDPIVAALYTEITRHAVMCLEHLEPARR